MKIKAWAAKKPKADLEEFYYERTVGPLDVLIQVEYCSFTRGDVCFIDNFWNDTSYPFVPSSEAFGVIKRIGDKVKDFEVGDFVGIGYQVSSCFECGHCQVGKEQFCQKQKVLGVNGYGALAEHIIFDSRFVYKIPKKLQEPSYVPLMCSGLTVFSAIKKSKIRPKMKVGVVGIGNLGHLAIQILNKLGCEVTAFSHSKRKEKDLRKLGARLFIDSTDKKQLEKEEGKYDFILSTSPGSLDWPLYIKALKPEGALCFVGLPEEKISFPVVLLADYAQRNILGSYIGSREEMRELLSFAEKNNIQAIAQVFSVQEIQKVVVKIRRKEIPFSTVIKI